MLKLAMLIAKYKTLIELVKTWWQKRKDKKNKTV